VSRRRENDCYLLGYSGDDSVSRLRTSELARFPLSEQDFVVIDALVPCFISSSVLAASLPFYGILIIEL